VRLFLPATTQFIQGVFQSKITLEPHEAESFKFTFHLYNHQLEEISDHITPFAQLDEFASIFLAIVIYSLFVIR
jgi:hypothetical protein